MKKKITLSLLLLIGLGGSFLFFPVKIGERYTCLFHFNSLEQGKTPQAAEQAGFIQPDSSDMITERHSNRMLRYYIKHFSFLWWGSLGLTVLSFLYLSGFNNKKEFSKQKKLSGGRFYES